MEGKKVVILGMHRSGTSVVTHWLQACGLPIGSDLLGAGVGNVDGHYEDLEFYRLHRAWLERNHLPHTGFVHAPVPGLPQDCKDRLRELCSERDARHIAWGWKEPRTCLFLDDYRELLPDAYYLVVLRDFRAVVSSMIVRIMRQKDAKYSRVRMPRRWWWFKVRRALRRRRLLGREAARFLKVWIFYNRQILALLDRLPPDRYAVVGCAGLLDDDREVFDRLTRRWRFPLRYVPFRDVYRPGLAGSPLVLDARFDATLVREAEAVQAELWGRAQAAFGVNDGVARDAAGAATPLAQQPGRQ